MFEVRLLRRAAARGLAGFAAAVAVTIAAPAVGVAALDNGPWPMFHRDLGHTAFTGLAAPTTSAIAWSAAVSDSVEFSSPVITSTGKVLIGDAGKELWAFNAFGNELWHYHTGGNLRYGTPAVGGDGTIYVGSADGRLYSISPNGALKWTRATGGAVKTAPAIAPDGTIYVGSDDGKLWAFDEAGNVKWAYVAGDSIRSSPAVGTDGKIYFGCHDGLLRALYPSGQLAWAGATGGPIRSAPAVYRGNIFFASTDGFLYDIHEDGTLQWATFTGENLRSSPAIGITGKIYLGLDTKIACFHDDGDPAWEFETGARVLSSPAVTAGLDSIDVVLCGSDNGVLYCVKNGVQQWAALIGAAVRSSPAIGPDRKAYVGAANGRLYCFGTVNPAEVSPVDLTSALRLILAPNPATFGQDVRILLSGARTPAAWGPVEVFDASGRHVRSLRFDAGGAATWDGRDEAGREVAAGIYLARVANGGARRSGQIVRLR